MKHQTPFSRRTLVTRFGTLAGIGAGAVAIAVAGASLPGLSVGQAALAAQEGNPTWSPGDLVVVNTDTLNLRDAAGLNSGVIATYPGGTTATILDVPVQQDDITWYPVEITGDLTYGWFAAHYLAWPDDGAGIAVTVSTDVVNLRDTYGLDSNVIGTYVYGDRGVVIGDESPEADGYSWVQVHMDDGGVGWIAADFLNLGDDGSGPGPGQRPVIEVIDGPVNLRADPGLSGAVIAAYPTGATGVYTGTGRLITVDGYDWINVRMNDGNDGYMATAFITQTS